MMTMNTLIKTLVGVNEIKIKNVQLDTSHDGVKTLIATVEPFKNKQCRCP